MRTLEFTLKRVLFKRSWYESYLTLKRELQRVSCPAIGEEKRSRLLMRRSRQKKTWTGSCLLPPLWMILYLYVRLLAAIAVEAVNF